MAEINLDLVALFNEQFGTPPQAFSFKAVTGDTSLTSQSMGALGSPYWANDINGRAVFMPITITYPDPSQISTQDADLLGGMGAGAFASNGPSSSTGILVSWTLPYCVITPHFKKTIVKTPLTERAGTVKELINTEDPEFTIEGFLISPDGSNDFPEADFTTLCRLFECNVAVQISSPITDIALMRPNRNASVYVVIEELDFPANRGVKRVKPYTLRLVGDTVFNLIDVS